MERTNVTRVGIALVTALVIGATAGSAQAANVVVNGGFETGDLTGWTVDTTNAGQTWFTYDSQDLEPPVSGFAIHQTLAKPPEGGWAAVTDQTTIGRRTLYQDVTLDTVKPGDKLTLSLYVYYLQPQNNVLTTPSPETLDPNASPNDQYRVDVVKPSAPIASVAPADVLTKVFQTQTGDPKTLAPKQVTADLTPFAGQTVRLRFTEVDSTGIFNASADGVQVITDLNLPKIQFSKPTRDRSNGTATLPAAVSGAGSVEISGEGIETQMVEASGAGTVQLPVTPVSPLKEQVEKDRRGMANIVATFTDSATGRTATDKRRVHLRNKRR